MLPRFDSELPTYWDEMIPEIESLDLKDKKVALFGLGDQIGYPDNFVDGTGILADAFEKGRGYPCRIYVCRGVIHLTGQEP